MLVGTVMPEGSLEALRTTGFSETRATPERVMSRTYRTRGRQANRTEPLSDESFCFFCGFHRFVQRFAGNFDFSDADQLPNYILRTSEAFFAHSRSDRGKGDGEMESVRETLLLAEVVRLQRVLENIDLEISRGWTPHAVAEYARAARDKSVLTVHDLERCDAF